MKMRNGIEKESIKNYKTNGFSCPLHYLQFISFLIYGLNAAIFFCINIISCYQGYFFDYINISIYSVLFLLLVILVLIVSIINPIDPIVSIQKFSNQLPNQPFIQNQKYFCSICNCKVQESTRHCGECNKCIELYDHHCTWINNCIGKSNYRYFLSLIFVVLCILLFQFGHNIYSLIIISKGMARENFIYYYGCDIQILSFILLGIVIVDNLIFGFFITELIIIHLWLVSKNLTSYEYSLILKGEAIYTDKGIVK